MEGYAEIKSNELSNHKPMWRNLVRIFISEMNEF